MGRKGTFTKRKNTFERVVPIRDAVAIVEYEEGGLDESRDNRTVNLNEINEYLRQPLGSATYRNQNWTNPDSNIGAK